MRHEVPVLAAPTGVFWGWCFGALLACFASGPLLAQPPVPAQQLLEDAELTDIFFQDPDRGWAIGDRGVIWRTDNGGRQWRQQASPVSCRLETITFVDDENGWIVGGWTHPYTHKSSGVVLRTFDGGRRWTLVPSPTLPALKHVKFLDARRGWAVGDASAMYPSGIFRTTDGGRSWSPLPGDGGTGWLSADFRDERKGVVAGRDGRLSLALDNEIQAARMPSLGLRHLRALQLDGATGGWLVGDGGLVMQTSDGGLSWQMPAGNLPDGTRETFDFHALATHGQHCWVAGNPGTSVFHSADGGRSWQRYRTDQSLPIRQLMFLDENRGWAVGPLGTILATRDGGRTWRRQRSGGTRLALLGIYSEPRQIPLEVFSLLCGEEGYLGAVEVLNRRDVEVPAKTEASWECRTHEALVAVGGVGAETAWHFPLRQPGLEMSAAQILQTWDRANDGRGGSRLEEHVVRRIRQWRPDVVLTERPSPRGDDPLAHLVNQIVLRAVQRAADPTAYSEQLTLAGLQPWKVKKVFSGAEPGQQATLDVTTAQLATRLGQSLADHAAAPRGLLSRHHEPARGRLGFQLLIDQLPQDVGRRDFFSGIVLQPGGEARRLLGEAAPGNLEWLSRMAQRRRNVEQLLAKSDEHVESGAAWLGQLDDLTKGLNASSAGDILYQLADRYHRAGHAELAAETLHRLVEQHADHPLSESALVWLVQYYASSEMAWRERRQTQFHTRQVAMTTPLQEQLLLPDSSAPDAHNESPQVYTRGRATTAGGVRLQERAGQVAALGKTIQRTRPALFAEPYVRFPLATAQREQGQVREAERFFHELAARSGTDAWASCVRAELWLTHANGQPPKTVTQCRLVSHKPMLDGRLDEPLWQAAQPLELHSAQHDDATWPAVAMMATDGEYLFVAISCAKPGGISYAVTDEPRRYDADLAGQDRVEIFLDLDRDYGSWYRLAVDHRGRTADECFGDRTWNPKWFVAADGDERQWTVEAAVALSELTGQPPKPGDAWALGVQRTVPDVGFQSWTQPAAVKPRPEGFGLLLFR